MKKAIVFTLIAITLVVAMGILNTYQIQGTITEYNTITDETGYIWEYDTNDFRVGDSVVITFHDRGTTNRADDIIKGVK